MFMIFASVHNAMYLDLHYLVLILALFRLYVMLHGTLRNVDLFSAKHSFATLLRHYSELLQHFFKFVTLKVLVVNVPVA